VCAAVHMYLQYLQQQSRCLAVGWVCFHPGAWKRLPACLQAMRPIVAHFLRCVFSTKRWPAGPVCQPCSAVPDSVVRVAPAAHLSFWVLGLPASRSVCSMCVLHLAASLHAGRCHRCESVTLSSGVALTIDTSLSAVDWALLSPDLYFITCHFPSHMLCMPAQRPVLACMLCGLESALGSKV
jgi:hypothetical protein